MVKIYQISTAYLKQSGVLARACLNSILVSSKQSTFRTTSILYANDCTVLTHHSLSLDKKNYHFYNSCFQGINQYRRSCTWMHNECLAILSGYLYIPCQTRQICMLVVICIYGLTKPTKLYIYHIDHFCTVTAMISLKKMQYEVDQMCQDRKISVHCFMVSSGLVTAQHSPVLHIHQIHLSAYKTQQQPLQTLKHSDFNHHIST